MLKCMTLERAKANAGKFLNLGCMTVDFENLCEYGEDLSIVGRRNWRLHLQSIFGYTDAEAKLRVKAVLKNLERFDFGRCIETVEGKQFVFDRVKVGEKVDMVLNASILKNWLEDFVAERGVDEQIKRMETCVDAKVISLAQAIRVDLDTLLESSASGDVDAFQRAQFLAHTAYKVSPPEYRDPNAFARDVAIKVIANYLQYLDAFVVGEFRVE